MTTRTKQMALYVTDEELDIIKKKIIEVSMKDNVPYSMSEGLRRLLLNGNAPPPATIQEEILETKTEDNEQDSKHEDTPNIETDSPTNFWDGLDV